MKSICLQETNHRLAGMELPDRIRFIADRWGDDAGVLSGFGYSGMILLYVLKDVAPKLPVYFIDTRRHFPETLKLFNHVRKLWHLNLIRLEPTLSEETLDRRYGRNLHKQDADLCCRLRKVEPFHDILHTKMFWMNALRRDQSVTRHQIRFCMHDGDRYRVHPLADWTRERCWAFIEEHGLPYNPLHDRAYPSIGCECCTGPVRSGKEERHGRWQSIPKLECGLNAHCMEVDNGKDEKGKRP